MKQQPESISLSAWTLWRPLLFAALSFAIMCGVSAIYLIVAPLVSGAPAMWPLWFLFAIGITGTTYFMLRRMPRGDLSQRGFIALNNMQVIVMYLALFGTIIITTQLQRIAYQMIMMGRAGNTLLVFAVGVASIFALYILGLGLSNLYAKFRRVRSMGVPVWAAILSLPFSFGLLWIPGYILPDNAKVKSCVTVRSAWYEKLTNKIAGSIVTSTLAFVILMLLSGLLLGLQTLLITGILLLAFFAWRFIYGAAKFQKNISVVYSWFAVATNIIMIIATIVLIAVNTTTATQNVTVNISDTAPELTE